MNNALISESLKESAGLHLATLSACVDDIARAGQVMSECLRRGGKVLFLGNGGSAADAQHLAAELVGRCGRERRPLPAVALTVDSSALTAIGNDYGFDQVFARQLSALATAGDVAVAISTSGKSPNVIAAARVARRASVATIALTGTPGAPLADEVDIAIRIPSHVTPRIQECHIAVGHILCELAEDFVFNTRRSDGMV